MRRLVCLLSLVTFTLVFLGTGVAHADVGDESQFLAMTNQARASAGVRALSSAPDLVDIARRHAAEMAASNSIWHNPSLATQVQNWQVVGENVGRGTSVPYTQQLFMQSAPHRANILDTRYTEVGIGTVRTASYVYVVEVFRQPKGAQAAAPAPAPVRRAPVVTPPRPAAPATVEPPAPAPEPPAPVVAPGFVEAQAAASLYTPSGTGPGFTIPTQPVATHTVDLAVTRTTDRSPAVVLAAALVLLVLLFIARLRGIGSPLTLAQLRRYEAA